jgi:hypothetical protein
MGVFLCAVAMLAAFFVNWAGKFADEVGWLNLAGCAEFMVLLLPLHAARQCVEADFRQVLHAQASNFHSD